MNKRPDITDQTKANLREAFWQLYAKNPLENITVAQVCGRAGYNRGTFYLHYHDLPELLEGIEDELVDSMASCVESCMVSLAKDGGKIARVRALGDVVLFYKKHERSFTVLLSDRGDPRFYTRLKDALKPLWRVHVIGDACAGRSEREVELILENVLTGAIFMVKEWLRDPGDLAPLQLGKLIYNLSIRSLPAVIRA